MCKKLALYTALFSLAIFGSSFSVDPAGELDPATQIEENLPTA